MFKLTIFIWLGLVSWNLHISLAQPVNCNNSNSVLQDPASQSNKLGHLFTIIGSILLTPQYNSPNEAISSLDRMEEPPSQMENQITGMLTRIENQLENIASSVRRIPEHFMQLGSRFFYIGPSSDETFNDANFKCRKMGGHLASIKNQEELDYILGYISAWGKISFWLATNDQAVEGHYVSSASNKTAPFLKWKSGEPSDKDHTKNCVELNDGFMYNANCNEKKYYICQADNDI